MPLCFCQRAWVAYSASPLTPLGPWSVNIYKVEELHSRFYKHCEWVGMSSSRPFEPKTCIHNFFSWFYFSFPPSSIISYAYMKSNSQHKDWQTWDFFLTDVYLLLFSTLNYNINEESLQGIKVVEFVLLLCWSPPPTPTPASPLPPLRQPWKRNHVQILLMNPGEQKPFWNFLFIHLSGLRIVWMSKPYIWGFMRFLSLCLFTSICDIQTWDFRMSPFMSSHFGVEELERRII